MFKTCNKCKQEKTIDEFGKDVSRRDGYRYICKKCDSVRIHELRQKNPNHFTDYYAKNKDKIRKTRRKHYKKNRIKILKENRINNKVYYEMHQEQLRLSSKKKHLKKKYGLTMEDIQVMLIKQHSTCAICTQPFGTGRICVDHDHITNKIRGLLCHRCNSGIGLLGDNIAGLYKAINYLLPFDKNGEEI